MKIYFDSSFLVSLYSADANSRQAQLTLQAASGDLVVTWLEKLETVNALELRAFRKEVSASEAGASLADFEMDLRDGVFELLAVPEQTFGRAEQLARKTTARLGTRTADLFHVAAALEMNADHLYSFDRQQRKLAHSVGLKLNRAAAV